MAHYVVEFRLPIEIDDIASDSPKEAALKARRMLEAETGLDLSNWFARVFEYSETEDEIGVVKEWFGSPGGASFREREKNIPIHEKRIEENVED